MEWIIDGLLPKRSAGGCVGVLLAWQKSGATTLLATLPRMAAGHILEGLGAQLDEIGGDR